MYAFQRHSDQLVYCKQQASSPLLHHHAPAPTCLQKLWSLALSFRDTSETVQAARQRADLRHRLTAVILVFLQFNRADSPHFSNTKEFTYITNTWHMKKHRRQCWSAKKKPVENYFHKKNTSESHLEAYSMFFTVLSLWGRKLNNLAEKKKSKSLWWKLLLFVSHINKIHAALLK